MEVITHQDKVNRRGFCVKAEVTIGEICSPDDSGYNVKSVILGKIKQ
jgi:hypothetical protein